MANIAAAKINSFVGHDRSHSPQELIFGWKFVFPTTTALMNAAENSNNPEMDAHFDAAVYHESNARLAKRENMLEIWKNEYIQRQNNSSDRFFSETSKIKTSAQSTR